MVNLKPLAQGLNDELLGHKNFVEGLKPKMEEAKILDDDILVTKTRLGNNQEVMDLVMAKISSLEMELQSSRKNKAEIINKINEITKFLETREHLTPLLNNLEHFKNNLETFIKARDRENK